MVYKLINLTIAAYFISPWHHYDDVTMSLMASQITSLTVVYSTVYSDADQRKHHSSASLALCGEFTGTGEFPAQRASYAEYVSIWWRHHYAILLLCVGSQWQHKFSMKRRRHFTLYRITQILYLYRYKFLYLRSFESVSLSYQHTLNACVYILQSVCVSKIKSIWGPSGIWRGMGMK